MDKMAVLLIILMFTVCASAMTWAIVGSWKYNKRGNWFALIYVILTWACIMALGILAIIS
jgi:hypothetical protein